MDNDKPTTFSFIISIIIVIGIAFSYMYLMNMSEYNSFNDRNERCKLCSEKYNLTCSIEHNIPSIYEYINNIHLGYVNCMNDVNVSNCKMCYPDLTAVV